MTFTQASQIDTGDRRYVAGAMEVPLLERDREVELSRSWLNQRNERALHELVGAHRRLVVRIAMGFRSSGLPLGDLIQEGNIGLIEAADRFDPAREVRFSTYASWWITAAIQNFILRNSSIVRAAAGLKQRRLFFNLRRLRRRIGAGRDGGLSIDERLELAKRLGVTLLDVEHMERHVARPDQSLNVAIGSDESAEIQDFLADTAPTPDEVAEDESRQRARSQWIGQALERLSPRERRIVDLRYLAETKANLSDIGRQLGISKERVRQIEVRALEKLKGALTELVDRPEDLAEA